MGLFRWVLLGHAPEVSLLHKTAESKTGKDLTLLEIFCLRDMHLLENFPEWPQTSCILKFGEAVSLSWVPMPPLQEPFPFSPSPNVFAGLLCHSLLPKMSCQKLQLFVLAFHQIFSLTFSTYLKEDYRARTDNIFFYFFIFIINCQSGLQNKNSNCKILPLTYVLYHIFTDLLAWHIQSFALY